MTSHRISVAIVLLAAGSASRVGGGHHKLLAEFDGVPLVRVAALAAMDGGADSIAVVTGHRHPEISACLDGMALDIIENPNYANGMASSIVAGLAVEAVANADGVMIMLADMPQVTGADLRLLVQAFRQSGGTAIARAASDGRKGNPVILPKSLRPLLLALEGDVGARQIIATSGLPVIDVEIGAAAHLDVDTADAVLAAGGVLKG